MASRALALVAALALLGAGIGAVVWSRHDLEPTRRAAHASAAPVAGASPDDTVVVTGSAVHVESGTRATTFLPLGAAPDDGQTLSEQRAFNALVADASKLTPIPATVRGYYGLLTDADASPPAVHVQVWAFAATSRCATSSGGAPKPEAAASSPRPQRQCRKWEFVDARSGHALGVVSREVLPD